MNDINFDNVPSRRTTVTIGGFKLDMYLTSFWIHKDGFYTLRFKVISYPNELIEYRWGRDVEFRTERRQGDVEFEVTLRPDSQDLNTKEQ